MIRDPVPALPGLGIGPAVQKVAASGHALLGRWQRPGRSRDG